MYNRLLQESQGRIEEYTQPAKPTLSETLRALATSARKGLARASTQDVGMIAGSSSAPAGGVARGVGVMAGSSSLPASATALSLVLHMIAMQSALVSPGELSSPWNIPGPALLILSCPSLPSSAYVLPFLLTLILPIIISTLDPCRPVTRNKAGRPGSCEMSDSGDESDQPCG